MTQCRDVTKGLKHAIRIKKGRSQSWCVHTGRMPAHTGMVCTLVGLKSVVYLQDTMRLLRIKLAKLRFSTVHLFEKFSMGFLRVRV